ncbi:hypothetical protein [Dyella sp. 2HG41-7]|uniref:hypothetical protein n=1 Tax=Dyella sp. 2HG41-7 TaxID=2883239 RepID=UPI001F2B6FD7|nr:hypothetical protein [Dyella sp. 2HG41-7]
MTETTLTIGAIALELGIPVGLLIFMALRPRVRPRAIVILGALFPALCLYGAIAVSYLISREKSDIFAFYAMWVMTFAPYLAVALGGLALSFLRSPTNYWARFGLGVLTTPAAYIAFVLVAKVIPWRAA